ncbi:MAG: DUF5060 domain-containing protein [Planctomycetaceae bacterium]
MMKNRSVRSLVYFSAVLWLFTSLCHAQTIAIDGEQRLWHNITLTLDGIHANESDRSPNPFTDLRFETLFTHTATGRTLLIPGYFAADGNAAETGSESGTKWRVHFVPSLEGDWTYKTHFWKQEITSDVSSEREPVAGFHGLTGSLHVGPSDKEYPDFRQRGMLEYVGKRYLKFAGTGEYFLKAGPDAPETLLAYEDFDGTIGTLKKSPLKSWAPHVSDWREGDPSWRNGRGKGLVGALNYLSGKGLNGFSFLTYNAGGDGNNVWPFVARDDKLHYDCSKLDQWGVVFDHATHKGLLLHFKLQENELDDNRIGHDGKPGNVPESLDGGSLGIERRLYCRELVARFGHNLALNWNIGEENTQSPAEVRAMAAYIASIDPYHHPIVIHTFPDQQEKVYSALIGDQSLLTGASLQNLWDKVHERTLHWIEESKHAGRPWVVANDEQNLAGWGVPPDPGYKDFDGVAHPMKNGESSREYTLHDIRKLTLWGNLMAGGAGVEYYFGYQLPENDLVCEDFRSRDESWTYCAIALSFFREHSIPVAEMTCRDELVGNPGHSNSSYCLAKDNVLYLIYLPQGGEAKLNLKDASGNYSVAWFNPRSGGELKKADIPQVTGGKEVVLGSPPDNQHEDWLIVVRREQ